MKLEIHKGNYDDKLIFRKLQPKIKKSYQKENDLEFQIMDWYTYDHDENDSESEEDEYDSDDEPIKKEVVDNKKYIIQLFGITKNGESVSCKIKEFPVEALSIRIKTRLKLVNRCPAIRPNVFETHLLVYFCPSIFFPQPRAHIFLYRRRCSIH